MSITVSSYVYTGFVWWYDTFVNCNWVATRWQ